MISEMVLNTFRGSPEVEFKGTHQGPIAPSHKCHHEFVTLISQLLFFLILKSVTLTLMSLISIYNLSIYIYHQYIRRDIY